MACNRDCKYRHQARQANLNSWHCDYMWMAGRSKLKVIYELTGRDHITPKVKRLLRPENCPCYEQKTGPRPRVVFHNKSNYNEARFLALYDKGTSDMAMAKHFGVAPATISYWRKRLDLPPNIHPNADKYDWKKARPLYDMGLSDHEIARRMGCGPSSVLRWRIKNDLPANDTRGRNKKEDNDG